MQIEIDDEEVQMEVETHEVEEGTFTLVEQMPEFPGGNEAMFMFLAENTQYPKLAIEHGIEGVVYIRYIIDKDGSITNPEVFRGIGGGCDEEALRVIASMPKWKPGMQRGKAVKVKYTLPFRFTLPKN